MRNCNAACLLGVILEVSLYILVCVVSDDLDGVLVGSDCSVAAETPELALDRSRRSCDRCRLLFEREVRNVIYDADSELSLWLVLEKLIINCVSFEPSP